MLIEAILSVCLTTPINQWKGDHDTGATCVYMDVEARKFPVYNISDLPEVMHQCMVWNSEGVATVQTKEHYKAIRNKLGRPAGATATLKAECRLHQYEAPLKCKDCGT